MNGFVIGIGILAGAVMLVGGLAGALVSPPTWKRWGLYVLAVLGVILVLGIIVLTVKSRDAACAEKGGSLVHVGNGAICVSDDGRILR